MNKKLSEDEFNEVLDVISYSRADSKILIQWSDSQKIMEHPEAELNTVDSDSSYWIPQNVWDKYKSIAYDPSNCNIGFTEKEPVKLFNRKHFNWLAQFAIDANFTEEQKDILMSQLNKTNVNFNIITFQKAMINNYNKAVMDGKISVGGI
tara:strand:+ start:633 stop:1082 length:450 start_codon:yes stop_codon:yes gene_type:complete